jgi:hypothetical protein
MVSIMANAKTAETIIIHALRGQYLTCNTTNLIKGPSY